MPCVPCLFPVDTEFSGYFRSWFMINSAPRLTLPASKLFSAVPTSFHCSTCNFQFMVMDNHSWYVGMREPFGTMLYMCIIESLRLSEQFLLFSYVHMAFTMLYTDTFSYPYGSPGPRVPRVKMVHLAGSPCRNH